jgi:hypothetical protein
LTDVKGGGVAVWVLASANLPERTAVFFSMFKDRSCVEGGNVRIAKQFKIITESFLLYILSSQQLKLYTRNRRARRWGITSGRCSLDEEASDALADVPHLLGIRANVH